MKLKDFFTQLKTQGKITDPEYDEWLKTAPENEISDKIVKAIEDNFLTIERATSHPTVYGKVKREALDPVDNQISDFLDQLKDYADPGMEQLIKNEPNTYSRLKSIIKLVPDALKKAKGAPHTDEETKKKLKEYEKNILEYADKFTAAEKDYSAKLKAVDESWGTKFNDYKLGNELEKLTNKYKLAEAYEETRPFLNEVTLAKLRAVNHLQLSEKDGRPVIIVNDESGKPKYNGNSPVTIDSVLDEAYKPFLKKSETLPPGQATRTTTKVDTQTNPAIRKGVSTTVQMKK